MFYCLLASSFCRICFIRSIDLMLSLSLGASFALRHPFVTQNPRYTSDIDENDPVELIEHCFSQS